MIREIPIRRLRRAGIRWQSPCGRWSLSGGGPRQRGCMYTLRDWQTGDVKPFRTIREAKEAAKP
jgi:hypothetical protein